MDLESMLATISEKTGKPRQEIEKLVGEKQEELSYLISPEGAAYLVARELGVELEGFAPKRLKIKNIVSGMRSVVFVGKIVRISDVIEFSRGDTTGKVRNVHLADESGRIRLTLWDDEVSLVDSFKEGDVVRVSGYSRDNRGEVEIRLGRSGSIEKVDEEIDVDLPAGRTYERTDISSLVPGASAEIKAAVVQVFRSNPVILKCPECGKRLKDGKCEEHGEVEPVPSVFLTFVVDDGTGNIRAVAFGSAAERLMGMTAKEAYTLATSRMDKFAPLEGVERGKEWIFRGYARKNEMFDRLEFVVNSVAEVDPAAEIERLI